MNVRLRESQNGRYWISTRLSSRHGTADGRMESATSDSRWAVRTMQPFSDSLWTKARDFPSGEGEDDGWIWPFNANNMNDTQGRAGPDGGAGGEERRRPC